MGRHMLLTLMILMLLPGAGLTQAPPEVGERQVRAPQGVSEPDLRTVGGAFLGQGAPGSTPAPFAANLAPALGMARAPVFSADGGEAFWTRTVSRFKSRLMTARLSAGKWTKEEPMPFSNGEFFDHNPAVSANGRRMVFASNRPIPGKAPTTLPGTDVPTSDLWVTERLGDGWSEPRSLGPAFNTPADEDCPVFAGDNVLYFSSSRPSPNGSPGGIFRAQAGAGGFGDPGRLPAPVSDAGEMVTGVAPDERYLLFYSMKRGVEGGLRVAFRTRDGSWSRPAALSPLFADIRVYAAAVTLDGRWLLLSASGARAGLYWMSAGPLDALRPGGVDERLPADPTEPTT